MANTSLIRTIGTPTSTQKFTLSAWIKKTTPTLEGRLISSWNGSGTQFWTMIQSDGTLFIADYDSGYNMQLISNRLFRDPSAWYHLVMAFDTTQLTAANRAKVYVNGVQETSFATETYPSQNAALNFTNSGDSARIGVRDGGEYFNGIMSYVACIDGTQELPTIFGETDVTTGEWKIKTTITPSVAWGNNGFLILKNGNSLTDESTNSNNFTLGGGTLTNTEDCPSNVFATFNALDTFYTTPTFTNGNTTLELNPASTKDTYVPTTLGMSSGKYYAEAKFISGASYNYIGIVDKPASANKIIGSFTNSARIRGDDGVTTINNVNSTTLTPYTTNDIIGIAVDLTNLKLYYSKNGVFMNSANPSSGTGGLTITAPDHAYFFAWQCNSGSVVTKFSWNFGNGYFGTSAVSSAGSNASSNGIFEYDVPTGYTALSTKGLNV